MAICKYCGNTGLFLRLDTYNMCKECREGNLKEIEKLQYEINNYYQDLFHCTSLFLYERDFYALLEVLQTLLDYIEKGYTGRLLFNIDIVKGYCLRQKNYLERLRHIVRYPNEDYYKFVDGQEFIIKSNNVLKSLIFNPELDKINNMHGFRTTWDLHWLYQNTIKIIYKEVGHPQALKDFIDLCNRDIQLISENRKFVHRFQYHSFKKLVSHYEKIEDYQKAIEICQLAADIGMTVNDNETYFPNKVEKLKKKLEKQ